MIDELAKELYRIADLLLSDAQAAEAKDGIELLFHLEPERSRRGQMTGVEPGTTDPWTARWKGHSGTGATAEMALLELKVSLEREFQHMIDHEQDRIDKASARIAAIRTMQGRSDARIAAIRTMQGRSDQGGVE